MRRVSYAIWWKEIESGVKHHVKGIPLLTKKAFESKRKSILIAMETRVKSCVSLSESFKVASENHRGKLRLFALLLSKRKRVLSKRATARSPLIKSGKKPRRSIGRGMDDYRLAREAERDQFDIALCGPKNIMMG